MCTKINHTHYCEKSKIRVLHYAISNFSKTSDSVLKSSVMPLSMFLLF